LINFLLLLKAVRWYNVALMLISQYLVAIFVFHIPENYWHFIYDIRLHLIVLSTSLALAGAFLVNGFYDLDKDLINQPQRVMVYKKLGQDFLLNIYAATCIAAILLALAASIKVFLFVGGLIFMFWFYSHKIQKLPLLREITATLLAIAPLVAVWLHYGNMHMGLLIYLGSLAIVGFTREVVKDLEGNKGNIIFGYQTVVVAAGKQFTKQWLVLVNLVMAAVFLFGFAVFVKEWDYFTLISVFSIAAAVLVSLACWLGRSENMYKVADAMLKVVIVVHLVSLVFAGNLIF
jgi:4-hydroxybenzoate polyprenyltransferase